MPLPRLTCHGRQLARVRVRVGSPWAVVCAGTDAPRPRRRASVNFREVPCGSYPWREGNPLTTLRSSECRSHAPQPAARCLSTGRTAREPAALGVAGGPRQFRSTEGVGAWVVGRMNRCVDGGARRKAGTGRLAFPSVPHCVGVHLAASAGGAGGCAATHLLWRRRFVGWGPPSGPHIARLAL